MEKLQLDIMEMALSQVCSHQLLILSPYLINPLGAMRLGRSALVFSKNGITRSVGLLSQVTQ